MELIIGKRLERRAGQMQREFSLDAVKRDIRFERIYALMCFVNDKHIPFQILDFFEFIEMPAEIQRAFQVLQADKLNKAFYIRFVASQPLCTI